MSGTNVFGTPLVDHDDAGVGPAISGVTWAFTVLATIAVALRFHLRRRGGNKWTPDDWVMLAALALQFVFQGLLTEACRLGLGKQYVNITLDEWVGLSKYSYIAGLFINLNPLVSRISIAILLTSLFGKTRRWFKWLLIGWTVFMAIGSSLTNILTLVEKDPITAEWDKTIESHYRFSVYIRYYTAIAFVYQLAISDLIYVFFPVSFIWKLHLPTHKKIGLSFLLGAGILTFGAAVAKIVVSTLQVRGQVSTTQGPVYGGVIYIVSGIEQCLVIVLGSVPALGPLSAIVTSFYSLIGQSLASLVTRTRRSRSRRSCSSEDKSSDGRGDVELGWPKRVSDDSASKARGPLPGGFGYPRETRCIRRTDNFAVTYA